MQKLTHMFIGSWIASIQVIAALAVVSFVGPPTVIAKTSTKVAALEVRTKMVSSIMWQPLTEEESYVYPPGVPAVLEAGDHARIFKVEQYFSQPVDEDNLRPVVHGTWESGRQNQLIFDQDLGVWKNHYLSISKPSCRYIQASANNQCQVRSILDERASFAESQERSFRCVTQLEVKKDIPAGTITVALSRAESGHSIIHPNSVFWVIVPVDNAPKINAPRATMPVCEEADPQNHSEDYESRHARLTLEEAKRYVVQIALGGSFSLGSGFITRDLDRFAGLFQKNLRFDRLSMPDGGVFVVSVAHLFPSLLSDGVLGEDLMTFDGDQLSHRRSFDLRVNGQLIRDAAVLYERNIESDVALLYLTKNGIKQVMAALELDHEGDLLGLEMATSLKSESIFSAVGFPAARNGFQVQNNGYLPSCEISTDDTSNFGEVNKFKIEAIGASTTDIAEPGMSGGPIFDARNFVVGIAAERPVDTNSLVAIDLTSLDHIQLKKPSESCRLHFNPFDRVLTLVNDSPDCDYGNFGSRRSLAKLSGRWKLQEILGYSAEESLAKGTYKLTNGHSIINGHAIINGQGIINGHAIIKGQSLRVTRDNLDQINREKLSCGFQLNPNSFRSFEPKGIRVLEQPDHLKGVKGRLITGTRDGIFESFKPVYSIRDFAIWLRQHAANSQFSSLLCREQENCY